MWEIVINIVLAVLSVGLAGVTYYLDVRKKVQESINGKVDKAEDTGETGEAKMAMVVNSIYYDIVPKVLRPILTKKRIEKIVQKAFDKIEAYAQKQAKNK